MVFLDYGYRSKCCLAAIRLGQKKVRKTNEHINVWVCVVCETKDVPLVTREEARAILAQRNSLKPEIDDDKGFSD